MKNTLHSLTIQTSVWFFIKITLLSYLIRFSFIYFLFPTIKTILSALFNSLIYYSLNQKIIIISTAHDKRDTNFILFDFRLNKTIASILQINLNQLLFFEWHSTFFLKEMKQKPLNLSINTISKQINGKTMHHVMNSSHFFIFC